MSTLVLGGARSGKSAFAQAQAQMLAQPVTLIVTARTQDSDAEMASRIAQHQATRPRNWQVVEAPFLLADALTTHARLAQTVIVDCLTLWLTNHLAAIEGDDLPENYLQERDALIACLPGLAGDVFLISNEVGLGIVPLGAATRSFRDEAGRLNQAVAAACQHAVFVAAGLPLTLK